jgi:hypothetical protein
MDFSVVVAARSLGGWSVSIPTEWSWSELDQEACTQRLIPDDSGASIQRLYFVDGDYRIDVFERRQDVMTWTREFSITGVPGSEDYCRCEPSN